MAAKTKNEILDSLYTLLHTAIPALRWHDGTSFDNDASLDVIMLDSSTQYASDFGLSTSAPIEVGVNVDFIVFAKGSNCLATVRSTFQTIYSTISNNIDTIYGWNNTLQLKKVEEQINPETSEFKYTVGQTTIQLKLIEKNL